MKLIGGLSTLTGLEKIGEWCNTLMSLLLPDKPKYAMPYPEIVRGHCLEDHQRVLAPASEHTLPSGRAVAPLPVHAVNAAEHTWKATVLSYVKETCLVVGGGRVGKRLQKSLSQPCRSA